MNSTRADAIQTDRLTDSAGVQVKGIHDVSAPNTRAASSTLDKSLIPCAKKTSCMTAKEFRVSCQRS